jgi:hypothetical protein
VRVEADQVVIGYTFDLRTNALTPSMRDVAWVAEQIGEQLWLGDDE